MQRNHLRGLLVCVVPAVVIGLVAGYTLWPRKPKPDLEHDGGTILVYEVDLERTRQRAEPPPDGLSDAEMSRLATQIRQRIDPTDLKNVAVRPAGDRRVEIVIPATRNADDVEEAKQLLAQTGVLEFRILANGADDEAGITAAQVQVATTKPEELRRLAVAGLPVPGPEGEFNVEVNDTRARVRYVWAELGPEERESLSLANHDEGKHGLYDHLAGLRNQVVPVRVDAAGYVPTSAHDAAFVLLSRKCESRDQLAREEAEKQKLLRAGKSEAEAEKTIDRKKVEYFVLTRVSQADTLRVGNDIALQAKAATDRTGGPCLEFTLNEAGARLFGAITRRNKPSLGVGRHLAIILDGRVMAMPTIQSEIGERGQITGRFDRATVERLVRILQSGSLSAELREKPVSEQTVAPTLVREPPRSKTLAIGLTVGAVVAWIVCVKLSRRWLAGSKLPTAIPTPGGVAPEPGETRNGS